MRKAMSEKVGAGGRFDIFLDSASRLKPERFYLMKKRYKDLNKSCCASFHFHWL